ncbi:MAG: hypothetical protein RL681_61 [Candidatus Parcubacteria bacterium]|jgi:sulfite exporter TauE/SafE/copper chaperone CopZ
MESSKKIQLHITGTHCASCEVVIERKFKDVKGVERAEVDHVSGDATVWYSEEPRIVELNAAVHEYGYRVSRAEENKEEPPRRNGPMDYAEIGAIFLLVAAWYLMLKQMNLLPSLEITENMGYGLVFLIGLIASVSTCMAVTGGLLVAVSARYSVRFPQRSGWQKLRPQLAFNAGRVIGYSVFGGLVGALGSVVGLSAQANGVLTIGVSIVMIILGFQLLNLFPGTSRFMPRMPKALAHHIHNLSDSDRPATPFVLGALTFFLPCGFTQALQLYVLATGSWITGALTMFVFALGTLPALLSLSALTSFTKGAFRHYVLRVAGTVVVLLGVMNMQSGIVLAGGKPIDLAAFFTGGAKNNTAQEELVPLVDGKQVVQMRAAGYTYTPNRFRVRAGVPVEWRIDGETATGCGRVITMPALGITQMLKSRGETVIQFRPERPGELAFNCSMGMMTPNSAFIVVPNNI